MLWIFKRCVIGIYIYYLRYAGNGKYVAWFTW